MLVRVTSFPVQSDIAELMEYATRFDSEQEKKAWELYESGAELYVFEEEGENIGLIGFTTGSSGQMDILHLAVRPEDRLKGYGRGLIVEALLLKQPKVVIAVTDEEEADFFRNIGFTVNGFNPGPDEPEQFRCVYESEEPAED
ncbi:GNAT family N-acetyltransferase [Paenibacillus sp. Marseille-P2973]|uniref:GNAT family N-acetyltransferase n=1 Tax=Paenibacillus sp. Marseille-P2973 TaxID=1871032 RepID=UPI001B379771|nr:GNAT family N-acetyltransferase [Paenibacillus sp. Marseille-P2973]